MSEARHGYPDAKRAKTTPFTKSSAWDSLRKNAEDMSGKHLRELLKDDARNQQLFASMGDVHLDYTRSKVDATVMSGLFELAKETNLAAKRDGMFGGEKINSTEGRSVLHVALRAPKGKQIVVDGKNVVDDVHEVLGRVKAFAESVRQGQHVGVTGKKLTNVVCIGIGGSYLAVREKLNK